MSTTESTWLVQLLDSVSVELVDSQMKLISKNGVVRYVVEYLNATPGLSLCSLVEYLCGSFSISVSETFCGGWIKSQ